jgi:RHS repeat-associated protein
LLAVNDGQLGRTAYTYDEVGNLRGFTYPNGVNTFYRYDSLNRLTNVTGGKLLDTLASYSYTLAPAGHRTSSTELNGRVANYAYDLLYRLTSETITGAPNGHNGTLEYSYDAVGNRLARNSNLPGILASGYAYDANDRLTSDLYDNNGNTRNAAVRDPASGLQQPVSDQYDFENRLINRDNGRIRIVYDGDGNRVRKTVTTATNVVTTFYLVDSLNPTGYPQVVEELTQDTADPLFSTPGVSRIYAWGHALLAQDRFNGSTWSESYYGYDGQSSVRYLTDTLGQVTDTYDYDAFGNLTARFSVYQTPTPNNYLYQGEHFDAELGLYYLRARYADPDRGRFWTMDSFEGFGSDPSSLHKYTFNHNDPLNRRDPSGHVSLTELVAVDTLAPMVSGMLRSLQQSFTQCNMLTAGLAGLQGAGIGAAVSAGITGLIQAFTGEFDAKAIAEAMAQGAEQGATEGFLLGLSPPAFMAYTGYQTFQAGLDIWNSFHDPNTPMWVKFMQGAGLAASVLPGVSPKLALKLRDLLKKFCFPAGTEVATAEGNKPIEEIREGDLVWAQSDQTGEIMLKRVKQVFVNVAAALVVLHCGTNTLEATPEHPLWIADQGWKAAGQIQVGDELFSLSGERLYVAAVRHKQGQFTVYNFEVEDFHSYFVGRVEVLGHNACVNAKHIFHGDVRKGKAKGFHHRGSIGHEGNARVVSEGPKNVQGAYSAQIEVRDPATGSWLRKTSTMFPDQWSRAQVLDEIQSVVASPTAAKWQSGVNTVVEGISPSGLTIRAYITPGGLIDSAHPVL